MVGQHPRRPRADPAAYAVPAAAAEPAGRRGAQARGAAVGLRRAPGNRGPERRDRQHAGGETGETGARKLTDIYIELFPIAGMALVRDKSGSEAVLWPRFF